MAQIASWGAVVDTTNIGESKTPGPGPDNAKHTNVTGLSAFLLWRGAYWTMSVSYANKLLIPMYWFKTMLFGRDLSRF